MCPAGSSVITALDSGGVSFLYGHSLQPLFGVCSGCTVPCKDGCDEDAKNDDLELGGNLRGNVHLEEDSGKVHHLMSSVDDGSSPILSS